MADDRKGPDEREAVREVAALARGREADDAPQDPAAPRGERKAVRQVAALARGRDPGRPTEPPPRPASLYLLLAGMLIQGVTGTMGGISLVVDPTGRLIQLPLRIMADTPFADFRIPGLILATVLGAFPLLVVIGLWRRSWWAWPGAFAVAVGLVIWLAVEVAMVGILPGPPLQAIYAGLAAALVLLTLMPGVRRHLRRD